MLGNPAPPFNRESLTITFGFPIPVAFVTFLNALCQDSATDEAGDQPVANVLWGLRGVEQRYPELFPIAGTGVGGWHFGYVIHAPEIHAPERNLGEYPLAHFERMDGDRAYLLGASTFEAVETEISFQMRVAQENDWRSLASFNWWPAVSARLTQLDIVPDP